MKKIENIILYLLMLFAQYLVVLFGVKGIPPNMEPVSMKEALTYTVPVLLFNLVIGMDTNLKKKNENNGRIHARKKKPAKAMCYSKPPAFCFGKSKDGKYIGKKANEAGSILICGSSGSGKSTTLIQSYLLNPEARKTCNALVLDMKHELTDLCVRDEERFSPDNPNGEFIVFDPLDRKHGYGYDPFFMLSDNSTEAQIYECMDTIALSIIPSIKGDNQVWSLAAQQLLRGALTYYYKEKRIRTLPEIIKQIKSAPIDKIVEEIVTTASPDSRAYKDVVSFYEMAAETLTSVDMNLSQRILPFYTSADLEWCLGFNPKKCSPKDLLERNIMLCIPEDKVDVWAQLVLLVVNQFLTWMMGLPEKAQDPDRKYLALILDETIALLNGVNANIPKLGQALRIGARGKGCTVVVCVQSVSGLQTVMSKEEKDDLVSNLTYKVILDSCNTDTSEEIIGWCGKYMKRKISRTSDKKETTSYEEEDIETAESLASLVKDNQLILVSAKYGYCRLDKCYVFKDKFFKNKLKEVKKSKEK